MTNQLFINNEFIESQSNETMDVINPATGENSIQLHLRLKKKSITQLKNLNMLNVNGNVFLNLHVLNM
ncbi:acyl-CoA reductase-like NAD-dependent aldehyde dehydrogenase [Staphylococcus capitis]|jgi:acyl-CoA reductase-like NAD-dependent aldehyde dehydrogenase|nr:glycine betaine aldehyde dehydrogenase gbsA [Staphylococcus capitis]